MPELMVAGLLFAAVAFLFFHNLGGAPATWHDEGAALTLASTLAAEGVYGIRSTTGVQTFGAVQSVGPTLILPAALLLRRMPEQPEARLRRARLVGAAYGVLASVACYLAARQLFGWPCAAWSLVFLLSGACVNYLRLGRMFQGEAAALGFFLLGWLALEQAVRSGSWVGFAAAGLLLGCAMLTKSTYVVGLAGAGAGTAALGWLMGRPLPWPGLLLASGVALACNAAWRAWLHRRLGPEAFRENARKMRELASTLAGVSPARNLRHLLFVLHPGANRGFFYLAGLLAWPYALRLACSAPDDAWFGLAFLLFFVAGSLGYLILALPLMTYLLPPAAVSSIFVARLWLDLLGSGGLGLALGGLLLALSLRDFRGILASHVLGRHPAALDAARFLERETPPGSVIETWERELGFLAERRFHYPDEACLVGAHARRYAAGGEGAEEAERAEEGERAEGAEGGERVEEAERAEERERAEEGEEAEGAAQRRGSAPRPGKGLAPSALPGNGGFARDYFGEVRPDFVVIGPAARWHGVYDLDYLRGRCAAVAAFGVEGGRYEILRWLSAAELEARPVWVLGGAAGGGLAEILEAEGLNLAACLPVSALERLRPGVRAILIPAGVAAAAWLERLTRFVEAGGLLVVFRPEPELRGLCGLAPAEGVLEAGWLRVRAEIPELAGFPRSGLRLEVASERSGLREAEALADLWDAAGGRAGVAVARRSLGRGGVVAWAYDLPANVARLRQGDPGRVRPGFQRATDLFELGGAGDLEVPEADEQQRLLARLLQGPGWRPPRLWYFPAGSPSVLVATGDAHGASVAAVASVLARVEAAGGRFSVYYAYGQVGGPAWKMVRSLAYSALDYLPPLGGWLRRWLVRPSPADFEAWRRRGHETGLHPELGRGLEAGLADALADHVERGLSAVSAGMRAHCVQWFGWVSSARAQARLGVRMNLDFYHWGVPHRTAEGRWVAGFLTGSGLPLRFMDEAGSVLPIFQQLTNLVDEHALDLGWGKSMPTLEPAEAVEFVEELFRRCVRWSGAVVGQFHVDPFGGGGEMAARSESFLGVALAEARRLELPILSAAEWCEFQEARRSVRFERVSWVEGRMELDVWVPAGRPLTLLLPEAQAVTLNGRPAAWTPQEFRGQLHAALPLPAGRHRITAK